MDVAKGLVTFSSSCCMLDEHFRHADAVHFEVSYKRDVRF